jgi:zinc protease
MLFKGTAKRKVGEIAREVETDGGDINAFTSYDETVFYLVIPSRYFPSGLDIMADKIQNSSFDPEELKREKEVVLEKVRMRTDKPSTKLDEALFPVAYSVHPYHRPIIGFGKTVQSFDRAKVMENFRIEHQTIASIAADMAFNERYGLGNDSSKMYLDKMLKVSVKDVQRAAKKYLDLTHYTLLIIKPKETLVVP